MKARVLPVEEWGRLQGPHLPKMLPDLHPEETTVLVVEDGEEIVGTLAVMRTVHLEGLWVEPAHRSAGAIRALLRDAEVAALGMTRNEWAYVLVGSDVVAAQVKRLGGLQVPLDVFILPLGKREG